MKQHGQSRFRHGAQRQQYVSRKKMTADDFESGKTVFCRRFNLLHCINFSGINIKNRQEAFRAGSKFQNLFHTRLPALILAGFRTYHLRAETEYCSSVNSCGKAFFFEFFRRIFASSRHVNVKIFHVVSTCIFIVFRIHSEYRKSLRHGPASDFSVSDSGPARPFLQSAHAFAGEHRQDIPAGSASILYGAKVPGS